MILCNGIESFCLRACSIYRPSYCVVLHWWSVTGVSGTGRGDSKSCWIGLLQAKEKNYVRYENVIYTGWRPVPLVQCIFLTLASHWARVILHGSASARLMGRASCWVHIGSSKSALSRLPKLSFVTLTNLTCNDIFERLKVHILIYEIIKIYCLQCYICFHDQVSRQQYNGECGCDPWSVLEF